MRICRITFRFFAILFGLAGMVLLIWLGYESYSLAQHAKEINQEFFTTVDRAIGDLDQKSSELQTTFENTVVQLEELERGLRNSEQRTLDDRVSAAVSETARSVSLRFEQATGVMQFSSDLLDVALKIQAQPNTEQAKPAGTSATQPRWDDRVREIQAQVRSVITALNDLRQRLRVLEASPGDILDKRDLTERLLRVIGKVKAIRDVLTDVHANLIALRSDLNEKRNEYDNLLGQARWIALVLALWMALGQFCVMKYLFRANDSPAPIQKSK
jgi:DNA-binding FrmR family transcriptional regulator